MSDAEDSRPLQDIRCGGHKSFTLYETIEKVTNQSDLGVSIRVDRRSV